MATRGRTKGFQMGPEHRGKIANSVVLSELIKFSEGKIPPDVYPPHRVTAALGLLKKVMPDLVYNQHGGDEGNPVIHRIERAIVNTED